MTTATRTAPAGWGAQAAQPFPFPDEEDFRVLIDALRPDRDRPQLPEGQDEADEHHEDDDSDGSAALLLREELRDFIPAPHLAEVVRRLVAERDEFRHLRGLRVTCLWRREGGRSQGKAVLAKATPAPKLWRLQAGIDATIWMAADHGRARRLTYGQVEACTYHELLHLEPTAKGDFKRVGHDFEGFLKELAAYGNWQQELSEMAAVVRQTRLPGFDRLDEVTG